MKSLPLAVALFVLGAFFSSLTLAPVLHGMWHQ
jgi:hypothetical protein